MIHSGSCHCGAIAFQVEGNLDQVIECNCSHCRRKGYLLWFVPLEHLMRTTSDETVSIYRFNTHKIDHCFCSVCGCAPFGFGTGSDGIAMASVNVRCLDNVDLGALKRAPFDGLSM